MTGSRPIVEPGPGVSRLLDGLGYTGGLLRFGYPVWIGGTVTRVPLVGFGRSRPQDMTTATIVAAGSSDGGLDDVFAAARALACPAVLLGRDSQVEIWSVPSEPGAEQQVSAARDDDVGRLATTYRAALKPDSLFAAKSAQRQLSLFPVDVRLLATAREGLFSQLTSRVEEAAILATSPVTGRQQHERLVTGSQVVVAALAALMIRDKFGAGGSGRELFEEAEIHFPKYFTSLMPKLRDSELPLDEILDVLGEGINYEALDPRVVSRVYEEAIVDRSERLKLGVFYTPPELADRILRHVPFEELVPEDRVVLDPACGSGTLLLAAYDRLQDLTPVHWEPGEKHRHATTHLRGMDQDQFAVDIARLALLLHALPEGDSWDVTRHDTLSTSVGAAERPSVIVSNPPWRDIRSVRGRRRQVADAFLEWMLRVLRPDGFFAVLLPSAWLTSSTSRRSRALVEEQASVFEVWRLPEDTFASARTAPCVLFGRAGRRGPRPWVFRRVMRSRSKETFYRTGVADETQIGIEGTGVRTGSHLRGPLDEASSALLELPALESMATVQNGPVPEPPIRDRGGAGDFLWLRSGRDVRAFKPIDEAVLVPVRFPEEFHRAGSHDGSIFRAPKLIIPADRSPANPWRLKVGIDVIGVIPRDSLHMVIPKTAALSDLHGLLAILGSAFASAWVDSYETKRAIGAQLVRDMPLPAPGPVWKDLASAGERMLEAASPELVAVRARELDEVVLGAYPLPERVRRAIRDHFAGFPAPEGAARYAERPSSLRMSSTPARSFGAVLGVESRGRLRLWVPGHTPDEGLIRPVPHRFLGWHCVEGATFDIDLDGSLSDAHFYFQRRSYQDFETGQQPSRGVREST